MEEEAELKPYVDDSKKMGLGGKHKTVMANSSLMMSAGDEDIVHEQDILDAVQSLVEKHHVEVFERFDRQDQLLAQLLQTLSVESPMAASDSVVKLDTSEANSSSYSKLNVSSGQRFASRWDKDDDQELKEAARSKDLGLERSNTKESLQQQHNSRLKRVVDHVIFEVFFAGCIMANALFIGIEVQLAYLEPEKDIGAELLFIGELFTFAFTVELLLRVAANGRQFFCSEQWIWNLLDVFIVVTALWETALLVIEAGADRAGADREGIGGMSSVRVIRILRITRLVRVTRIARIMRFIRALNTLVQSIIFTLRSLVWAMVLLFMLVYIFGIIFTQAVSDAVNDPNIKLSDRAKEACSIYWAGLPFSMLSLFMSISGGVSWEMVIAPLHEISGLWSMVYLFYISFSYFAVLNVVTGVFCQSAIDSAQSDHELVMHSIILNKAAHIEKIKSLFHEIDSGERGYITFQKFDENVNNPAVQTWFEALELDVNDAWEFFKLLDSDGGASIEIEEFLMGCLRLRGGAKALDMAHLIHEQRKMANKQGEFMSYVEDSLGSIRASVKAASRIAE